MSRRPQPTKDVTPYWAERGFRLELANVPPKEGEDPKGELAYQRAFYEAAQSRPPRLPNPNHYPNSASAREWMRKRSMDFAPSRAEKRASDAPAQPAYSSRKFRNPDQSPPTSLKQSASASPASNNASPNPFSVQLPLANSNAMIREESGIPQNGYQPGLAQSHVSQLPPRLGVLEPSWGPTGPANEVKFR